MSGSARIDEGSSPVFEQLRDGQQRGGVFIVGSHLGLQPEHVREIVRAQVVREQAPDCVGIAYVHVPINEAGGHYHSGGVDHGVGDVAAQFGGFANATDLAAGDDDGPVGDDATFGIHRYDVPGVFNLDGRLGHVHSTQLTLA